MVILHWKQAMLSDKTLYTIMTTGNYHVMTDWYCLYLVLLPIDRCTEKQQHNLSHTYRTL